MEKKEAMKILKDFHDKSALFSVRTALDTIIPELRESEDERIRKAILELVRQSSEVLDKQNQNNMIAWLEKQGYTKKDVDDAYLKGICDAKHELEKQGEQKSVDKVEPFDKYEGLTDFERTLADICIGWIGEEPGWKQYIKDNADVLLKIAIEKFNSVQDTLFEQKPAWSEEDIRNIQDIDSILFYDKDLPEETCMRLRNWLKSLKPHTDMVEALRTEYEKGRADTLSEMKSSWSEEDEKVIAIINNALTESNTLPDDYDKVYDWLESLRKRIGG